MQAHDFTAGSNRKFWAITGKYFKTGTCRRSKGSSKNYQQRKLLLDTCLFFYYYCYCFLFSGSFLRCQIHSECTEPVLLISVLSHRNC